MSGIANSSSQWSSPVESVASYPESQVPVGRIPRHSILTRETFENESHSTSSSGANKDLSPYEHGEYYDKLPFGRGPRSSSMVSAEEQMEGTADVLEALRPRRHHRSLRPPPPRHLPFQLSQDSDFLGGQSSAISLPLSQSTSHSAGHNHSYPHGLYKPSSPTSSSDNASISSSVHHRLGSGPASDASFPSSINLSQSTTSSRSSYVYRLPRPSLSNSNPGSTTNILPSRHHSLYKEDAVYNSKSYHHQPMSSKRNSRGSFEDSRNVSHVSRREGQRPRSKQKDDKGERDSFSMKLDVVMSMMSALSTSSQSDADAVKLLLALSQSSETCSVLRQSTCMSQLIKIIHNKDIPSKDQKEVKSKGLEALRNIVESNPNSKVRHCERSVLSTLNKIRAHCDQLFVFIHTVHCQEPVTADELEVLQKSCNSVLLFLRKLLKYSSSRELHRPAILNLGGLQTIADILICDHNLPKKQENIIGHSSEIIAVTITILINLTYGDVNNKLALCSIPDFLNALMSHFYSFNEQVMSKGAQVIRNLSCKATPDIKECLMKCQAVVVLMEAVERASSETTIQHITSALWNMSAHSIDNRYRICKKPHGVETLVHLLSFNSPSGTTVIVENVGGVLRNLSSVISQEQEYRTRFREAGGLDKLVQHLKSRNKVVLANATGILWNLSARCPENQSLLWDLGCIPLLDILQTSPQKNISENARGALRNLLAFGQSQGWTSRSDLSTSSQAKKAQKTHSKSTMALTSGPNASIENIRSGRSSAPFVSSASKPNFSAHQSSISLRDSLYKMSSSRGSIEKPQSNSNSMMNYKSDDFINGPRFSRVSSAPQPNDDEWMNYRPVAKQDDVASTDYHHRSQAVSHTGPSSQVHPSMHHQQHKKHSRGGHSVKLSNGHSYSYSQSESCESEFQSVSGASLGLSPQLPTEDGMMRNAGNVEVAYDELDIEIDDQLEEDEVSHCHYRNPSEPDSETSDQSIADQFVRDRESVRRIASPSIPSPSKLSPNIYQHKILAADMARASGTSGLALDGTTPSQDGLEPISEANDIAVARSGVSRSHSNSSSSGGAE